MIGKDIKRLVKAAKGLLRAKLTAWWRTKITHRCCRTCEHWDPWLIYDGLVGPCAHCRKVTNYMTYCENWHKKQHQEVPPCNMTVK